MADLLQKLKESKKELFVGMAGPGTGKSTAFKTVVDSEEFKGKNILILSFINKLVDDLSVDFQDVSNVQVSTLHSFATKLMGQVNLDPDLDELISEDHLYIKGSPVPFEENFQRNTISEDDEKFYKDRKEFYKHENNLYSLNSVIYAINKVFEKHEDKIPNKFDLILVDEFQDFNNLEYEFIKHLNKKARVVVVGDDNQSLYFFKKAEPRLIRELYNAEHTEEFSLDYCFRCTEVVVDATNDLITNAKKAGFLKDGCEKTFEYPRGVVPKKDKLSDDFPTIDFLPAIAGDLLIYKLEADIKKLLKEKSEGNKKRILILAPSYLKQTLYDGLVKKGFNVVEFELFGNEQCNKMKHRDIVDIFYTLSQRKTDNLALRKVLKMYLSEDQIKEIVAKTAETGKGIWYLLEDDVKSRIEADIALLKKVGSGKKSLTQTELIRFSEFFNLKNILSKMVKGFSPVAKSAIELELTTVMSSKGLSADYVYYVGIDNDNVMNRDTGDFTDQSICEFLVGITRAKEKLTLISLKDKKPKILDFLDSSRIQIIGD